MIDRIREAAAKQMVILPHAIKRMNQALEPITDGEVLEVIFTGEVIEDYPEDVRGHSCLMAGETSQGRVVHVCCAPKANFLAIITVYIPNPLQWEDSGRKRRKSS